jgi:hypothetical protein
MRDRLTAARVAERRGVRAVVNLRENARTLDNLIAAFLSARPYTGVRGKSKRQD